MAITIERQGQRLYLVGDTYAAKDRIKQLGGHWDGDRRAWWVGAAKEAQAQELIESLASATPAERTKEDPSRIRLSGKGIYKGRPHFIGATTRDGTRCRLLTLPNAAGEYLDFWADVSQVEVTKHYQAREYRGRTEYTTLGSIAAFIGRQKRAEAAGEPACAACGKRGALHYDLEDGLEKCFSCCDIPE